MSILKKFSRYLHYVLLLPFLFVLYMFFYGASVPYASEQDMYEAGDTYIVNLMYVEEENNRIYFSLFDYNRKLFNGRIFELITDSSGPKKFDFYTIDDELVLVENNKLNLILEERGID